MQFEAGDSDEQQTPTKVSDHIVILMHSNPFLFPFFISSYFPSFFHPHFLMFSLHLLSDALLSQLSDVLMRH